MERHLARLTARHALSAEERAAVEGLVETTRRFPAGSIVVPENRRLDHSTLLIEGMLCRFKDLSSGQRQVTAVHVPGDFADLHSFTLKRLEHNIAAQTDCLVGIVPHERLTAITERYPRLTRIYWFLTNLDAAMHREWELSLGRRNAEQRLAALLSELDVRMRLVGLADENGFDLPITQADLSECMGLTAVHVNRMIRRLREQGLATVAGGRVQIHDMAGLHDLAEFDDAYLYLSPDDV